MISWDDFETPETNNKRTYRKRKERKGANIDVSRVAESNG